VPAWQLCEGSAAGRDLAVPQHVCGWPGSGQCDVCGTPLDAGPFDSSSVVLAPSPGEEIVLARYTLQPTHCGILRYFAQFTDRHAKDPTKIRTPGYQWQLRSNTQPLDPYLTFDHIINPWGLATFPVEISLGEGATIEFVIRNTGNIGSGHVDALTEVGGRIVGKHWYNTRFGGAPRRL
jgi:hypothetical protein